MIYRFSSLDRLVWPKQICDLVNNCVNETEGVTLYFDGLKEPELEPMHIVSLACAIEKFSKAGLQVRVNRQSDVGEALWSKYRLKEYWGGKKNYSPAVGDNILNLWRVVDSEKDMHAERVTSFLRQRFFKGKDLSSIKNNICEVYYNAFDHADAGGNIFSMITYNQESNQLQFAVCDFGMGIAQSVRKVMPSLDDKTALLKAIESGFTTSSTPHNAGFGLDNIRCSCIDDDKLYIISGEALLLADSRIERAFKLEYDFPGTLVFIKMSVSHLEDEETMTEFSF